MELGKILEAILFAAERPMASRELRQILGEAVDLDAPGVTEPFRHVREAPLLAALEELKAEYETQQRGFQLVEVAGGWRLVSRPEYAPWLRKLLNEARPHRLSLPALETLAIVALRQPIARADIAAIRGVEVDGVMKTLLERDLITIVGRSEDPGRPMLYGTTQRFLEQFGLRSLEDMPKAEELRLQAAALKAAQSRTESTAPDEPEAAAGETPAADVPPIPSSAEPSHEGQTSGDSKQD